MAIEYRFENMMQLLFIGKVCRSIHTVLMTQMSNSETIIQN